MDPVQKVSAKKTRKHFSPPTEGHAGRVDEHAPHGKAPEVVSVRSNAEGGYKKTGSRPIRQRGTRDANGVCPLAKVSNPTRHEEQRDGHAEMVVPGGCGNRQPGRVVCNRNSSEVVGGRHHQDDYRLPDCVGARHWFHRMDHSPGRAATKWKPAASLCRTPTLAGSSATC